MGGIFKFFIYLYKRGIITHSSPPLASQGDIPRGAIYHSGPHMAHTAEHCCYGPINAC